jgi:hypothetical protein
VAGQITVLMRAAENCPLRSTYREQPILHYGGPLKSDSVDLRQFTVKTRKIANIGNYDTGCSNMSRLQTLFCDMPQRKSKLESEL